MDEEEKGPVREKPGPKSSYVPKMCDLAIEEFKKGAGIEEVALVLGCRPRTVYAWKKRHPEFAEALEEGRELAKGWWMKRGRESLNDKTFSYVGWYMNMKNRFGWRDMQHTQHDVTVTDSQQKVRDKESEHKY